MRAPGRGIGIQSSRRTTTTWAKGKQINKSGLGEGRKLGRAQYVFHNLWIRGE